MEAPTYQSGAEPTAKALHGRGVGDQHMITGMRRTIWVLLLFWVFQTLAGTAWSLSMAPSEGALPSCHGYASVAHDSSPDAHQPTHADADRQLPGTAFDTHHCCAVAWTPMPELPLLGLAQPAPLGLSAGWFSLNLRPDLRPPI